MDSSQNTGLQDTDINSEKADDMFGVELDPRETSSIEENPFQRPTDDHALEYLSIQRTKSFLMRNFSALPKGGLRASMFTMFSSTIGAGLLSLPKVLAMYGVASGVLFLIIFGILTRYTYYILNELVQKSGKKSYANMCSYFLGKTAAKAIINLMIVSVVCGGILYASVCKHGR